MIAIINWIPVNDTTSTGQRVQYKLTSSSVWITFSTVSKSTNTATISGLTQDTSYDFRIVNICGGNEHPSDEVTVQILNYYWGVTSTNTLPTESEIESSQFHKIMISGQVSVECDFTTVTSFNYWWVALKSIEGLKSTWIGEEIDNTGNIGGTQNLFKSSQTVGNYIVYFSNYKTLNTQSPITLTAL